MICFKNCQGDSYFHRHIKNRMIKTFMIVNITPTCKRQIINDRGYVYAFLLQKGLPFPLSLARNRIYLDTHLTEELTNLF